MCSLCGVGAHAPPGCLSKTGTKAMGVKAAARVVNGALTTMPPQQWQRWRCTRAQRRSLCLMQRRASRPRCPDCHWGARAAVCGKAQYRGPRCSCGRGAWPVRGAGRRAKRAATAHTDGLRIDYCLSLPLWYAGLSGRGGPRASARGVSRGTLFGIRWRVWHNPERSPLTGGLGVRTPGFWDRLEGWHNPEREPLIGGYWDRLEGWHLGGRDARRDVTANRRDAVTVTRDGLSATP